MEVKCRSWKTRAEVTVLIQVTHAASSDSAGEQWVDSGCILKVEQIDWKWDVRERGKSKLVVWALGRMETMEGVRVLWEVRSRSYIWFDRCSSKDV